MLMSFCIIESIAIFYLTIMFFAEKERARIWENRALASEGIDFENIKMLEAAEETKMNGEKNEKQ